MGTDPSRQIGAALGQHGVRERLFPYLWRTVVGSLAQQDSAGAISVPLIFWAFRKLRIAFISKSIHQISALERLLRLGIKKTTDRFTFRGANRGFSKQE